MANKHDLSFSIKLLKMNRKHHKKGVKQYTITKTRREQLRYSTSTLKHVDDRLKAHKTYLEDLNFAITILEKLNTKLSCRIRKALKKK